MALLASVKQVDYSAHRSGEPIQSRDDTFPMDSGEVNLVKDYFEGRCYLGFRCVSGEFKQYGFVFQSTENRLAPETAGRPGHAHVIGPHAQSDEPFVLPLNIELMQRPQIVAPSFVWVDRFDDFDFGFGEPLFTFYPCEWIGEFLGGSKYRKVRVVAGRHAIALRERGGEKVQTASERINDGASFGMDHERKRQFLLRYRQGLAGISIGLLEGYLYARRLPGQEPMFQDWELGFAPINGRVGI
jgi:hypothetical protein